MDALRRLVGAVPQRQLPSRVESDDVYPVHLLDGTKTLRGIVVTWTLQFNDVLDAGKLHASLSNLLEIGDWRKLGGRLRLKDNGDLEIHVPRPFTAERPTVSYAHQSLPMNIEDHPLAKTLPKATEGPSIQAGPQIFREFAAVGNAPETLEDFVYTDAPQLSLLVTSFSNATLVALSWPHTLMDVMGQQALLRGWSLVLADKESEVPRFLGAREDAVCAAADAIVDGEAREEYSLGTKRLKGWAMAKFGLRFAGDLLWNRVVETRTIFLPKHVVARMRREAEEDLSKLTSPDAATEEASQKHFISEGDVLTAWSLRAVASSLPQPRPVAALHALNARFRLSSLIQAQKQSETQPAGGVYVQNMAVAAFTFISPDVSVGPLGPIALENRRHLMEQATEPQVLAYLRELRRESKPDSRGDSSESVDPATMLYCESDALLMPFTNWTRADFFTTLDFSPALVRAGKAQSRSNPPGTMVSHHAQSMRQSPTVRNVVVILGKDHAGNYWLTGTLLPQAWAKIEEDLERR